MRAPPVLAIVVGILASGLFGVVTYFVAVRPVLAFDRFSFAWLVCTLAVALLIQNFAALDLGADVAILPGAPERQRRAHRQRRRSACRRCRDRRSPSRSRSGFEVRPQRTLFGKLGMAIA